MEQGISGFIFSVIHIMITKYLYMFLSSTNKPNIPFNRGSEKIYYGN